MTRCRRPLSEGAPAHYSGVGRASVPAQSHKGRAQKPTPPRLTRLLLLALVVGFALSPLAIAGIAAYLAVNVAYSFKPKHQPVVDLFCVASGFVLRIAVGAFALPVPLTSWMLFTMTVKPALAYTVPCVLFGLFRYWFLVESGDGESPTDVV